MANPQLIAHIRYLVSQGSPVVHIRQALVGQGWAVQEVEDALVQAGLVSKGSWRIVMMAAAGALVLVVAVAVFMWYPRSSGLLDVSLQPLATEVTPGSPVEFIVELVNLGSARRFDVHLTSEVVSVETNAVIAQAAETIAIETRNAVRSSIVIPRDAAAGNYVVRTIAAYDGQVARASFSLKVSPSRVVAKPDLEPGVPEGPGACLGDCNDYDPCTRDQCIKGRCVHEAQVPCCGNLKCERGESESSCPDDCRPAQVSPQQSAESIISRAISSSLSDVEKAARLCRTLPRASDADKCFSGVAKRSGQPGVCSQVIAPNERDGCLLDIALDQDRFELCDAVVDRWLKSSCFSYANLKSSGR